ATDVAEALYRYRGFTDRDFEILEVTLREISHTRTGRLASALRTAEGDRFARDDRARHVADVVRSGVHHPAHDFFVGLAIRRRHAMVFGVGARCGAGTWTGGQTKLTISCM